MTPEEQKISDDIVSAWNGFVKLEPTHPDDIDEFRMAIHSLQKIIGMRILRRDYPDKYPTYDKNCIEIFPDVVIDLEDLI